MKNRKDGKRNRSRRALSLLLALTLVFSTLLGSGLSTYASADQTETTGMCNHVHDESCYEEVIHWLCGYEEGDVIDTVTTDGETDGTEAVEAVTTGEAATEAEAADEDSDPDTDAEIIEEDTADATVSGGNTDVITADDTDTAEATGESHVHSKDTCDYEIEYVLNCQHVHDATCGYYDTETTSAADELQERINALPSVAELEEMDTDEIEEIYAEICDISDIYYDDLTEEEQEEIDAEKLLVLLEYFTGAVATLDDTEGYNTYIGSYPDNYNKDGEGYSGFKYTFTVQLVSDGVRGDELTHDESGIYNIKRGNTYWA